MPGFLKRKIDNLVTRAVIKLVNFLEGESEWKGVEQGGKVVVQVTGLAGEVRSDVEHLQQYGTRSIPLGGGRGILVAYGGSKDNGTMIVIDDKRYGQFTLQPGDMCIYSKNGAHTIYRGDDIIEILDVTRTITIGTMIEIISSSGLDIVDGDITCSGEITAKVGGTAIALSTHKHNGSATAPDGPVSDTGGPIP